MGRDLLAQIEGGILLAKACNKSARQMADDLDDVLDLFPTKEAA